MNLLAPLRKYTLTQKFGGNANDYYATHNLTGHTGADLVTFYNDIVQCSVDSVVYKVMNKDNPDLMAFRAVCTLFQDNGQWYELQYAHLNHIFVDEGDILYAVEPVGTEGNTGPVYSGGVLVTAEEKKAGSTKGFHLHWQLRPVTRSLTLPIVDGKFPPALDKDGLPYKDKDGFYYLITNYNNGFAGCIDPMQFLTVPTGFALTNLLKRCLLYLQGKHPN